MNAYCNELYNSIIIKINEIEKIKLYFYANNKCSNLDGVFNSVSEMLNYKEYLDIKLNHKINGDDEEENVIHWSLFCSPCVINTNRYTIQLFSEWYIFCCNVIKNIIAFINSEINNYSNSNDLKNLELYPYFVQKKNSILILWNFYDIINKNVFEEKKKLIYVETHIWNMFGVFRNNMSDLKKTFDLKKNKKNILFSNKNFIFNYYIFNNVIENISE